MKASRAAKIWAQLERQLIERCGLPDGHMLDRERPSLIRRIGSVLSGRAVAGETVSPPLPELRLDDSAPSVARPVKISRRPVSGDTVHDSKLAAMLDRACSLRGYDGDDGVGYS